VRSAVEAVSTGPRFAAEMRERLALMAHSPDAEVVVPALAARPRLLFVGLDQVAVENHCYARYFGKQMVAVTGDQ
jgi:hypothetical protein